MICDKGGIWLDSDSLVMNSLDPLFDIVENTQGFFIKENNNILWNGIFGSRPATPLMLEWKRQMMLTLDQKQETIAWSEIGCLMLQGIYNSQRGLYKNYRIFEGLDTMYPVNWNHCVTEFLSKPYDNYKTIIRDYQPVITLVNSVYKRLESMSEQEILDGNMPLNYFINKSFDNMKLVDTLIQAHDETSRVSISNIFKKKYRRP